MDSILLENYLASQFKFGFELEAFKREGKTNFNTRHWDDDQPIEYDDEEESHWDDDQPIEYDDDYIDEHIKKEIAKAFDFNINDIDVKEDGSLRPDDYDDYDFEWASPVMNFTPKNIKKCIKGLDTLMQNDYYTNDSCGFHVHLSFPNISDADCVWILSKLSVDEDMLYTLTNGVAGCEFYSDDWAEIDFIKELGEAIKDGNYEGIAPVFTTEKYRMLHIHPQGTIEWRGPRGFMNSVYHIKPVYDFFKLLHKFVMWIGKALASHEILGMSKNNYFKIVFNRDYKENDLISGFKRKEKEKAAIRRLKIYLNGDDSSKFLELIKKFLDTYDIKIYNYITIILNFLNQSVDTYSKFIKDFFIKTIALEDDKFRNKILQYIENYDYLTSKGFLYLTPDEMFYYFFMTLSKYNENHCLENIIFNNSDNKELIEQFNKALKNCESQELNKEMLMRLFRSFRILSLCGKYIKTPEIIDKIELENAIFNNIKLLKATSDVGLPKSFNENDFKNNYAFNHIIKICLVAHENDVLANFLNDLLNKMFYFWSSASHSINNNKEIAYCKYLQHIILTGNTNYELNMEEV